MPRDDDAGRKPSWSTVSRLAHLFSPPPPKFLGDFRADASDTDEESLEAGSEPGDDARRGRRASISANAERTTDEEKTRGAPAVSRGLIAAVTAKTKARAEARAVAEARAEAARRITEAAERAEEDKKARNRALVENFRAASRAAAAAATASRFRRESERAATRDRREEIGELWAAELAFEGATNVWRDAGKTKNRLPLGTFAGTSRVAGHPRDASTTIRRDDGREYVSFRTESFSHSFPRRRDALDAHETEPTSKEKTFVGSGDRPSFGSGTAETETKKKPRSPPPTAAEARLHATYARRETREYGNRCAKCDAGASHSAAECDAISEALKKTSFAAPRVPPPPGFAQVKNTPDDSDAKIAARACAALLLQRRTRSEVHTWFDRESPTSARLGLAELRLERRGLGPSLPSLASFFALTFLDVSRNRLTRLPENLGDIAPLLETIDASANALVALPEGVGGLFFLKKLVARGNRLATVPSLAKARALEHLDVSSNASLRTLPNDLVFVKTLRQLIADGCVSLSSLPEALGEAQDELRTVRARRCRLTRCPEGVALARALETLDLGSNSIAFLPDALGGAQQPSLRVVRVDDNLLRRLPRDLQCADALEILDCSSNALRDVAPLVGCGSLVDLNVADNAIAEMPRNLAGGPERARAAHEAKRLGLERARQVMTRFSRAAAESAQDAGGGGTRDGTPPSGAAPAETSPADAGDTEASGDAERSRRRARKAREKEKARRKLDEAERAAAAAALANASRVVGLRRLRAANNRLTRLPPCLGATLTVGGAGGRVVDLRGNPLDPPVLRMLAERNGVDTYVDRLASTHFDATRLSLFAKRRVLEDAAAAAETIRALRREAYDSGEVSGAISAETSRRKKTRAFFVSREAPGRLTRLRSAVGSLEKQKTKTNPRRLSWCGESRDAVFAHRVAFDPRFAERLAILENARASAVAARARAVSRRARRWWRLAIFSVLKRLASSQARAVEAVEGFARREAFRETVADASRRARDAERATYAWILDAPSPLDALPHRLRCALARKCRAHVASRNETVWNAGDDGDFAVVVVEGACALVDDSTNVEDDDERARSVGARGSDDADVCFSDDVSEREFPERTWGPRLVVSAEYVLARARASGSEPPARPGARACAGMASLLTGDPRRRTLRVVGARARYYAIPRGALAEVLNEDDAARAREFRERRARVAASARTAASDLFASIAQMGVFRSTGRLQRGGGVDFGSSSSSLASGLGRTQKGTPGRLSGTSSSVKSFSASEKEFPDWDDAASDVSRVSRVSRVSQWAAERSAAENEARLADAEARALEEHARASRLTPPDPSPRDALFAAEARRTFHSAFPLFFDSLAEDDPEKAMLVASRTKRARKTAHALGLGPPVGLYAAHDRHAFPWTRGWRDGGWLPGDDAFGYASPYGFVSGLETNAVLAPTFEGDAFRAHDSDGFPLEYFQASRDHSEPLALRAARLDSGGAVARDRLRLCGVLREALDGAETRHVAAFCGAATVTCARDDGVNLKEHETRGIEGIYPTVAEAAALMGVEDARAERVKRLVSRRSFFFAERDDDDDGAAFLIVDGCAELVSSDDSNTGEETRKETLLKPPTCHGVGEIVGLAHFLTGSKPDATARAASSSKSASVSATAIRPAAARAAIDRRPVILDALATRVARHETRALFPEHDCSGEIDARLALEAFAARRAARLVAAAEARFFRARRLWSCAGETVLASARKKKHTDDLARGGVDAFRAAALGAAGAGETDDARETDFPSVVRNLSKKERDARKFARGVPDAYLPRELAKASAFRWLTPSESIAVVARGARRVRVTREGEPLCVQGHVAATAFVVLKGKLEAFARRRAEMTSAPADPSLADGGRSGEVSGGFFGSRVRELRRGDVIGADCLFTGAARDATVFAVSEEAWVLEIQRKAVAATARRRPVVLDEIAKFVVARFSRTDERDGKNDKVEKTLPPGWSYVNAVASVESWILRGERHEALRPEVLSGTGGATRARLAFGAPTRAALAALAEASVFDGVDRIRKLVMLHDAARLVTHPPGSAVVKQGDDGNTMFAVVSGTLDVVVERLAGDSSFSDAGETPTPSAASSDGFCHLRETSRIGVALDDVVRETVRVLGPGDVFGELSLLTGAPRNATVAARAAPEARAGAVEDRAGESFRRLGTPKTRGAVLVEIGASAIAPLLRNRDTNFARSASLATARRYAPAPPRAPGDDSDDHGEKEKTAVRKALHVEAYAEKLELTMRQFHVAATRGAASLLSATTTRRAARAFLSLSGTKETTSSLSAPAERGERGKKTSARHWRAALAMTEEATARRHGIEAFTETFARRLARHPFFSLLTRAELQKLRSACRLTRAHAGGWLKKKGDVADSCLVVVAGVVNARFETELRGSSFGETRTTEELRPWCLVGARHAILRELDREDGEDAKKKTEASSASFAWPATLAAAPPSAEAVEIPGRAIAEIVLARPTLRVLVDALDAEGRLR